MISPLKPLRKPKSLKRLKGLGGKSARQELPSVDPLEERFDLTDPVYENLLRSLGDAGLVKRVMKLQKKFPVGTVPELVTYDWLTRQRIEFEYQVALYGGRTRSGGIIPDFVLRVGGRTVVWNIQGNYWHTLGGRPQVDEAQRLRMLASKINGQPVKQVMFLWESRILGDRPKVFVLALAGVELGP